MFGDSDMGLRRKAVGEPPPGTCTPILGAKRLVSSWLEKVNGLLAQSGRVGETRRSSALMMGGGVIEVGLSSSPLAATALGKPAKLKLC